MTYALSMKNLRKNLYDYVIVGGGVAGLSCAYWLSKQKGRKVALVDSGELLTTHCEKYFCDLTVGSLNHLYRIYKHHGVEKVVEVYKYFERNLDLIASELEMLERDSYVSLYNGETISLLEQGDKKEIADFQSFIHELSKFDLPIKEVAKKDAWEFGAKYGHNANYQSKDFIEKIYGTLKSEIDIFEKRTCKTISRRLDEILMTTVGGDEFRCKKIILANSNSLSKLLPELKDKVKTMEGIVYKFDVEINNLELVNYANQRNNGYYAKLQDGFYFAKHAEANEDPTSGYLDEQEAKRSFDEFTKKTFPGVEICSKGVKAQLATTKHVMPLVGQSKTNPHLFYLGGFDGQSKLYAFKMAKDLVEKIKA